jgi:hypothetical protein
MMRIFVFAEGGVKSARTHNQRARQILAFLLLAVDLLDGPHHHGTGRAAYRLPRHRTASRVPSFATASALRATSARILTRMVQVGCDP